jgi:hypothetical protein
MTIVTYEIDAEDRIQRVDGSWSSFALENGADQLAGDRIIRTSIWDWISGVDVRHTYRLVFDRVRETRMSVSFPFRCDSPDTRRFMKLSISPRTGAALGFDAQLVKAEERPPVALIDPAAEGSDPLVALCSWCKRARSPGDLWLEIEDTIPALGLLDSSRHSITHTICPECTGLIDRAE